MIDFRRGHTSVCGMTGTGKTTAVKKYLQRWSGGVLFINTMHGDPPRGFVQADGSADIDQMMRLLDAGEKINFMPVRSKEGRNKQFYALKEKLFETRRDRLIVALDEAGEYDQSIGAEITNTGRQWGLTLVTMTPRLARLSNDIMTQSPNKVIFCLEDEANYCKSYGIDYWEIERRNHEKDPPKPQADPPRPSHAYCVKYAGILEGAYVEKI